MSFILIKYFLPILNKYHAYILCTKIPLNCLKDNKKGNLDHL